MITKIIAAIFISSIVVSCQDNQNRKNLPRNFDEPVPVTVEPVKITKTPIKINTTCTLKPTSEEIIKADYEMKLSKLFVSMGSKVDRDDILFQISEENINDNIDAVQKELRQQEARLNRSEYYMRNRDMLLDEGLITREQYEGLEDEIAEYKAAIEELQRKISKLEKQLEHTTVRSPISGFITKIHAKPNELIKPNTPILTITNSDPIMCAFKIPTTYLNQINLGSPITITVKSLSHQPFNAEISYISTTINSKDETVDAYSSIPNPDNILKAGMEASVKVVTSASKTIYTIPTSALIHDNSTTYVYTVIRGRARKTPVKFIRKMGNTSEVSGNFRKDDIIIVNGIQNIEEGTKVNIWGK